MDKWLSRFFPALLLTGAGLLAGAITGWLALLTGETTSEGVVSYGTQAYGWLTLLLPLTSLVAALLLRDKADYKGHPLIALPVWLLNSAIGTALATVAFVLLSALITTGVGGVEATGVFSNYLPEIGRAKFSQVLAANGVIALMIGIWYSFKPTE